MSSFQLRLLAALIRPRLGFRFRAARRPTVSVLVPALLLDARYDLLLALHHCGAAHMRRLT